MRRFKLLIASLAFVFTSAIPVLTGSIAGAQLCDPEVNCEIRPLDTFPLRCPTVGGEFVNYNYENCDLAINKQVSVNGSAFVDADTSSDAATASVGDTVIWKITVSNTNPQYIPSGFVYINDVLPTGVTYVSHLASAGDYNHNCGCFFENDWYIPMQSAPQVTTLPATLTITTTATTVGLIENTATFVKYDPGGADGGLPYSDADPSNNSNSAWVFIQTKPQVLGSNTLANTGSGTTESAIAAVLILGTALVAADGRLFRKSKAYKII